MRSFKTVVLSALLACGLASAAAASEGHVVLPKQDWPHASIFGVLDQAAARRGFQIYKEVCSACHSLRLLSYRNLSGIGFKEDEIKALAAQYETTDGPNDQGEMFKRPSLPSDRFTKPFANDQAARAANNGALPPDLSLIAKARMGGEDYIAALLTGYDNPPEHFTLMDGMNYNKYFPGNQIGMPKLLNGDDVTYADGVKATAEQEARDVATFLVWAAEPNFDQRKTLGLKVMLFLFAFSILMYAAKRELWSDVH